MSADSAGSVEFSSQHTDAYVRGQEIFRLPGGWVEMVAVLWDRQVVALSEAAPLFRILTGVDR